MTPSSAKAKGRRLQQLVRDAILASFPDLTEDDVRSTSMGAGGEDVQLSSAARRHVPYGIECKARANLSQLYGFYDQAKGHGKHQPLLILKGDRRDPLAVIDFQHFLDLIRERT